MMTVEFSYTASKKNSLDETVQKLLKAAEKKQQEEEEAEEEEDESSATESESEHEDEFWVHVLCTQQNWNTAAWPPGAN